MTALVCLMLCEKIMEIILFKHTKPSGPPEGLNITKNKLYELVSI
jgi:hypothetical protein